VLADKARPSKLPAHNSKTPAELRHEQNQIEKIKK
jgi:hypothetical protein